MLSFPFPPPPASLYHASSGGVSLMALSHDLATLVVAGKDGSVVVFDIKDVEGRPPMLEGGLRLPWSDDVQTTLGQLEAARQNLVELKDAVSFAHKVNMNADAQRRDGELWWRLLAAFFLFLSFFPPHLTPPRPPSSHSFYPPQSSSPPHPQSTPRRWPT